MSDSEMHHAPSLGGVTDHLPVPISEKLVGSRLLPVSPRLQGKQTTQFPNQSTLQPALIWLGQQGLKPQTKAAYGNVEWRLTSIAKMLQFCLELFCTRFKRC